MTDCELTNLRIANNLLAEELAKHREAIRRLAEQDATLSVHDGCVIVTMDATLTDEEREAIRNVLHHIATKADYLQREDYHLRSLLERTK